MRRALALIAALAAVALAGCGGPSAADGGGADVETTDLSQGPRFNGGTVLPVLANGNASTIMTDCVTTRSERRRIEVFMP